MRNLFLLVGPPASGKTKFIKDHHLESYTISADQIRETLIPPAIEKDVNDPSQISIPKINFNYEDLVWQVLRKVLEAQMQKGETIFVDATHLFKDAFKPYFPLIKKYHYNWTTIDLTPQTKSNDELLELLKNRDAKRENAINDQSVLTKYINRYHFYQENQNLKKMTVAEFEELLKPQIQDFNRFDQIKIIGDIHGDYTNLKQVMDQHQTNTAYVFVGDYLDRGTENAKTFKLIQELHGDNIFKLRGNHEQRIEENLNSEKDKQYGIFGKVTIFELYKAAITKEDMRHFLDQLQDRLIFTFQDQTYLVSHAGLEPFDLSTQNILTPEMNLVNGTISQTQRDPYLIDVDQDYIDYGNPQIINVHGHRNTYLKPVISNNQATSINLTSEYEHQFRYLTITKKGELMPTKTKRIDAPAANPEEVKQIQEIKNLADTTDLVKEHNVTGHEYIKSYVYTKKTFQNNNWNDITTLARGFFVYENHIVGRGFHKFFKLNENPEAKLENLEFPVKLYEKYNGSLGIAFLDPTTQDLILTTKSGSGGIPTQANFVEKIVKKVGEDNKIYQYLLRHPNQTVLMEIISTKDPHMVYYDQDQIHYIGVLNNSDGIFNRQGEKYFKIKPRAVAKDMTQLQYLIDQSNQEEHEGLVLRDTTGFMLKVKAPFYNKGKELRNRLTANLVWHRKNPDTPLNQAKPYQNW